MNSTNTLEMVFNLDNGKELTISLAGPKEDLTAETVASVMSSMITKNAINYNGAALESAKTAYVKEVKKTILF